MSCFLEILIDLFTTAILASNNLVNTVVFSNTCQGTVPVRFCSYFSSERFCHTKRNLNLSSFRTEPGSISTFLSAWPLQKKSIAHLMPVFNHKLSSHMSLDHWCSECKHSVAMQILFPFLSPYVCSVKFVLTQ